jgi:hypothetical protein
VAGWYLNLSTTLQYSFYLACSWLWCLGGFFPLILGRDYGWPALAAFTAFNVGGAISMGFYFKQRAQQQTFESKHKPAIAIFSYVTIAYQLFFVAWLGAIIDQPLLLAAVLAIAFVIYHSKGVITHWALAFYILSIGLFVGFLGSDWPPVEISAKGFWPHALLPLAIGFIFSPYLDITFHRAYKSSGNPKLSFTIGFGILFLSLLGFVFFYAGSLGDVFFNQALPAAIIYPVIGFLALQIAFTIAAHCSELSTQQYLKPSLLAGVITVFSVAAVGLLTLVKDATIPLVDLPLEETLYKSFLFFYSLVFPLYLVFGKSKSTYLWVIGICTPAYSMGFLMGGEHSYGLTIGVAIMTTAVVFKRQARA